MEPTGGAFDGVIAPTVPTYLPLSGDPVEVNHDPLPELEQIAIEVGGQTFPAVHDGVSRLEFAGVPEVTYLLRRRFSPNPTVPGAPHFLSFHESAARELGMYAGTYSGRPDVATTKAPGTTVSVSASGMTPLGADDRFELYSYNADALASLLPSFDPLDGSNSPEVGATALVSWELPWDPGSTRDGWTLVDPDKGDDLRLAHLAARQLVAAPVGAEAQDAWSYALLRRIDQIAPMTLPGMSAGATAAMNGQFAPVAEKKVTADFRLSQFRAELETLEPTVYSLSCVVRVFLEPGIEHPIAGIVPTLGEVSAFSQYVPLDPMCPPDACDPDLCASCEEIYVFPDDRVVELSYGNPYSGGTETMYARCRVREYLFDPNNGDDEILVAEVSVAGKLADLSQGPIVPKLGLVHGIEADGVPLSTWSPTLGVGTTPTISFEPPSFGAPDRYVITVYTVDDLEDLDGNVVPSLSVGVFATTATSITLPAGILQEGSFYYLRIGALRGSMHDAVNWYTHDVSTSYTYSGIFTP